MREALVTLRVETLVVAVRAKAVREVLGAYEWTRVPGARADIPGVIAWAGRAVAVFDLARVVPGLRQLDAREKRARTVILQACSCTLAVPADEVSEVWQISLDAFRPKELHDFPLARSEVVTEMHVLPVFEPELLLTAAGVSS